MLISKLHKIHLIHHDYCVKDSNNSMLLYRVGKSRSKYDSKVLKLFKRIIF